MAQCSKFSALIFAKLCKNKNLFSNRVYANICNEIEHVECKSQYINCILRGLPAQLKTLAMDIMLKEDPLWYKSNVIKGTPCMPSNVDLNVNETLTFEHLTTLCNILRERFVLSQEQTNFVLNACDVTKGYNIMCDILSYKGDFICNTVKLLLLQNGIVTYIPYSKQQDDEHDIENVEIEEFINIKGDLYIEYDSDWETCSENEYEDNDEDENDITHFLEDADADDDADDDNNTSSSLSDKENNLSDWETCSGDDNCSNEDDNSCFDEDNLTSDNTDEDYDSSSDDTDEDYDSSDEEEDSTSDNTDEDYDSSSDDTDEDYDSSDEEEDSPYENDNFSSNEDTDEDYEWNSDDCND
ncbi:hypothetical protein ECIV_ORF89 [European chub iridovirus]|nr:hypothetical protein ECIV_ORF89 [European chub iridovirus]